MEKKEIIEYFHLLFQKKLEKEPSFVWDELVSNCVEIFAEELFIR